ncbi:hypothetical protein [Kitasatospora sp. NPDC051914]|uniref:hypothetical protein n=1 Tax=Kitasatospora sp. NPDC051914 TaxID=3154945 RepID=UPI00342FB63C
MEPYRPERTDRRLSLHTALVRCPRCDACARRTGHRVVCTACGLVREAGRSFAGPVLATASGRCPTCGRALRYAAEHAAWPGTVRDRELRCGCGTASRHPVAVRPSWRRNQGTDPVSGLSLWLCTGVRGHVLWALDADHLDAVEEYVAAVPRPPSHGNATLTSRLPVWIKSAKNRRDVLIGLGRLRDLLPAGSTRP